MSQNPASSGLQEGDWFVDRSEEGEHDPDPFLQRLPPKTIREVLTDLWYGHRALARSIHEMQEDIDEVKAEAKRTNGRVTNLEKFRWLITGGLLLLMGQAAIFAAIIQTRG